MPASAVCHLPKCFGLDIYIIFIYYNIIKTFCFIGKLLCGLLPPIRHLPKYIILYIYDVRMLPLCNI
jgi:hypothetical protein